MKLFTTIALALGITAGFSGAALAAAPSKESIDRLLADVHMESILEGMRPRLNAVMKASVDQATQGSVVTPDERKVLDKFQTKVADIMAEDLKVEKLIPLYERIYTENLTQEDVDDLIAFYESPTGKVFVAKMPQITQAIMQEMPGMMMPMFRQIEEATRELKSDMSKLKSTPAKK